MIQDAFWGILIPFLGTSLGAGCVFFLKNSLRDGIQRALTGFAAGVMVAASVWSLLIPAMEQAADLGRLAFFPAAVGFWLGILFLLLLDHLIPHLHQNSLQAEGPKSQLQRTTMMVLAVTLHNIPEGMAVGVVYAGYLAGTAQITAAGALARRYRSGEYRERCELLREVYGNPALTTDVIVGFPQESEEEFRKSYDFVDSIRFYETHIFKYSRRQGTKAAAMDGQLTEAEKSLRSEKMIELHHRHAGDYEKSMLGKNLEVLIEEEYTKDGRTWYLGHSREYIKTAVPKSEAYGVNDIVSVKAEGFLEEHIMTGEAVE